MFSASPPTTDMRRLHRNDRFLPKGDMAVLFGMLPIAFWLSNL
jgi:hypothetical protein